MNNFLKLLLGTSLYVLEQSDKATKKSRARAADNVDDLRDFVQDKYETASSRLSKASSALRGDDSAVLGNALRLVAGIGIGVGIGLILAPASGAETRTAIAGKVQGFGDKVRKQFSSEDAYATGTTG
jgi:hypothetical protein